MDVFCVLRCRICSLHQYFEGTCCIHVQTEATLTLKMEAARSKVTPLVICDPTRCQDPEDYRLVYICSGGLETSRINVCALVCLSFVLSVRSLFPLSIMDINTIDTISHNLLRNIMKSEMSPPHCAVKPCLHEQRCGGTEDYGSGNISTPLS
jgi:hypothetical protein